MNNDLYNLVKDVYDNMLFLMTKARNLLINSTSSTDADFDNLRKSIHHSMLSNVHKVIQLLLKYALADSTINLPQVLKITHQFGDKKSPKYALCIASPNNLMLTANIGYYCTINKNESELDEVIKILLQQQVHLLSLLNTEFEALYLFISRNRHLVLDAIKRVKMKIIPKTILFGIQVLHL
jgi:hypothetical protein